MTEVDERVSLLLRLRRSTVVRLDGLAAKAGVSRSQVIRELLAAGFAAGEKKPPARMTGDIAALSKQDEVELRWWRAFADRTVVNGDLDKQVQPGIDLPGWTFHVMPAYDEHLKGIA